MFIKSLHLKNWTSHEDTMLVLDKLSVLRADNGAGKTSIEQALQMLFTGRSESTQDNGNGSRELIRKGGDIKGAYITAEVFDKFGGGDAVKMRATLTEKSGRTVQVKKESDPSWTGSDWLAGIALKREIYDCLINSRYFTGMDGARQKNLLAGIILPTTATFENWVESAVNECGLGLNWSLKAFDLIAEGYKNAYSERTAVNRLIKEWREPEPVPVQELDAATIRTKLSERQNERTQAALDKQKITDKWERAQGEREKLSGKISGIEMRLATEQTRRAEVARGLLSKAAVKEHEDLAKNGGKASVLDADAAKLNAELAILRKTLARLDDIGTAGTCPTCTQAMTDEIFERVATPLITQQDKLITAYNEAMESRKALGDYEGAAKNLDAHNQAEKNLKLVDAHIAEYEKDIDGIRKEMEKVPSEVSAKPDTSALDAKLADLDERIRKGNAALTAVVQADANRKHYAEQIEAKKKLDRKQALLEKLVDYFGPKGIQAKLLDEHVGGFESSMNTVLKGWGYRCHLQFDPFVFGVSFDGKEQVYNLQTISASQTAMFSIAFQVALAKVSGLNFVVVDAADIFLDANRSALYGALIGAGLDQVIVTQSDLRREIPKIPNAVFYMFTLDRAYGEVPRTVVERL